MLRVSQLIGFGVGGGPSIPYFLPTFNSADKSGGATLSNSARTVAATGSTYELARSVQSRTQGLDAAKCYVELTIDTLGSSDDVWLGIANSTQAVATGTNPNSGQDNCLKRSSSTGIRRGTNLVTGSGTYTSTYTVADVFQIAIDNATGDGWMGINNTWGGGGDPAAGTTPLFTVVSSATWFLLFGTANSSGNVQVTLNHTAAFSPPSGFGFGM